MDPQYICEADIIMNEVNYVHSQFGDVDPFFWFPGIHWSCGTGGSHFL